MTREEAALKLSFHLMQCGMLMPIGWVDKNGEGSELFEAFKMAQDALRERDVTDTNVVKTNADHIRSMTDEELLGCLLELRDTAIKRFANFELPNHQWMADWLKQPYEEDT